MDTTVSRWWDSVSLRSKITGVTVLVLTVGLLLAGVGTVTMLRPILEQRAAESLANAAAGDVSHLIQVSRSDDNTLNYGVQERDEFVAVYNIRGELLGENWLGLPEELKPDAPAVLTEETLQAFYGHPHELSSANETSEFLATIVEIAATPGGDPYGYALFAQSTQQTETIIASYLTIFFGLGTVVIVIGALITRLLVTRTFRPLRNVEDTAAAFAEGDFNQRLPAVSTPNTEVGRLNRSLNMMLSRIDSAFTDRANTIAQMRRFVGDASHELRTPLVTLRGYAELYRMGAITDDDDVAQAMERIEKEAIRMGLLVEDLLELARLDETRPLLLAPVDLTELAHDAAMDARAASPSRTISVSFSHDDVEETGTPPRMSPTEQPATAQTHGADSAAKNPNDVHTTAPSNSAGAIAFAGATLARIRGLRGRRAAQNAHAPESSATPAPDEESTHSTIVLGEENKLRQVITNLMGNALRFSPDGTPIELAVTTSPAAGTAAISVIDHGDGIPPQIRDKVFQRLWRADTSRARDTGGSGLGLAIVSSIVSAHGGTVSIHETPGGGATFTIELPLENPSARGDTRQSSPTGYTENDALSQNET